MNDPLTSGTTHQQVGHGTCPTCGAAVAVVASDEGTMHFRPVDEPRIRADEHQRVVREVEAWFESREVGTARISDFRREFGNEGGPR